MSGFLFFVKRMKARQTAKRNRTIRPKVTPILAAVSIKNGSGTMLIKRSVAGSRIHRSLSKKILWKITKYFVKSVDITAARTAVSMKKIPVPAQRARGRTKRRLAFDRIRKIMQRAAAARQPADREHR